MDLVAPVKTSDTCVARAGLLVAVVEALRNLLAARLGATEAGGVVEDLLMQARIQPEDLDATLQFVALSKVTALLEAAAVKIRDPFLGARLVKYIRPGQTGLMGQLCVHAPDVETALKVLAGNVPAFMRPFDAHYRWWRQGAGANYPANTSSYGELSWSFRRHLAELGQSDQFSGFIASAILIRLRPALPAGWVPLEVRLEQEPVGIPDDIAAIFGPNVIFQATDNAVRFTQSELEAAMPDHDPQMFDMLDDLARRWLQEVHFAPPIKLTVREEILNQLTSGRADLKSVASALKLPPRTLQSKLEQQDLTFEGVLDEIRAERAMQLLRETDLQITDIAYDLGYSDPSVLSRAMRRWCNKTPREIRSEFRARDKQAG